MDTIATIGTLDTSISYIDRPTVKVIIKKDDLILLLNDGLLPGGGIEKGESDLDAISRELQEELGAEVDDIQAIGEVIQYRNLLRKRYVIKGYTANLLSIDGETNPQDMREAQFIKVWLTLDEALERVLESIDIIKTKPMDSDGNQGKLYNLMTTYELLKRCKK